MKTTALFLFSFILSFGALAQVPVLYYDFENNADRSLSETTPEQSINTYATALIRTTASGLSFSGTTGAGTTYGGSASGSALSSNRWSTASTNPGTAATQFYTFTTSTTGFSGLALSFDALRNTGAAPQKLGVLWSTDSAFFYPSSTAPLTFTTSFTNLKFTLPSGAENQHRLYIRIYAYDANNSNSSFTLDNLTLSASTINSSKTLLDYAAIGLSLASGTAFDPAYSNLTIGGIGTVATLGGNLKLQGTVFLAPGSLSLGFHTLFLNGNVSQLGGTINAGSGTISLGSSSPQVISPLLFTGAICNLTVNNTAGVTAGGNLTVNNTLSLAAGTFYVGSNTLVLNGNLTRISGILNASAGTLVFSGSAAQTVAANVFSGSVSNLAINNAAGVVTAADATVTNTLQLQTGTYDIGATTHTLTGSISRGTGALNAALGSLVFDGTAVQEIPVGGVTTTINNLTVNNPSGLIINTDHSINAALSLQAGTLRLNGKTLTLNGTVTGYGTFTGSATSGLVIAGTSAMGALRFDQTLDGTTNALASLTVSFGQISLGNKLNLYNMLTVSGGVLDLAGKNLVLKSLPAQTAAVGVIRGTVTGDSNVTVERYIPALNTRRYRLLTAPITNSSINAAWQEGGKWNGVSAVNTDGYGTLITGQAQGNAATANAHGFDFWSAISNGGASIRSYVPGSNNSSAIWQPITSTLTPGAFDNHQAYLLFVRGDRSVSTGTNGGAATVRATGTLKKGNFTINAPAAQSHTLIGNPYASPIDFKQIYEANSSKIQPSFYIWQSSLGTGTGGYVLVQPVAPGSDLYEAIPGNGSQSAANRLIHSGEGFFVMPASQAAGTNPVIIREEHKSTGTPGISVFRQMGGLPAKLYVNLSTGTETNKTLLDGVLAQFDDVLTLKNFQKAANSTENLSIQKTGKDLTVTSGALPKAGDTIKLRLWNTTAKEYHMEIRSSHFAGTGLTAILVDRYLNKERLLDLGDAVTTHTFMVDAGSASKGPNRFFILFKQALVLPVTITGFRAEAGSNNHVSVQWKVADEADVESYQVERAEDGIRFTALTTKKANSGSGEQAYEYIDAKALPVNYYRVKIQHKGGEINYTSVVKIRLQNRKDEISLYPNPVRNGLLNLQFVNKPAGLYTIVLYNLAGQVLLHKTLQLTTGTATEAIPLGTALAPGLYKLEITDAAGNAAVWPITIQR